MMGAFDPAGLVRDTQVSARVYTDPELFSAELTQLFDRSWVLLGHECQIAEAGQWMLQRLGLRSVIVARQKDGGVAIFENRCTHRGASLCGERQGRSTRFVCPYHSWTFGLDGRLIGMPLKDDYPPSFDMAAHGLRSIPHVETYRGFIFASEAPVCGLLDFLGAARRAFDDMVDRSPEGRLEPVGTALRYKVKANWKMVMENLNDTLHPMSAHASAIAALRPLKDRSDINPVHRLAASSPPVEMLRMPRSVATPWGHSYTEGLLAIANIRAPRDDHFAALAARHGEAEAERILNGDIHVTLLYPSATINSRMQTIRLVRPLAVDETEVVSYAFRLVGAPDRVLDSALDYVWIASSPASFVVVDDFEIYERCQETYARAPDRWVSVDRGSAGDAVDSDGNLAGNGTSEGYIRNQYRVWARYLSGGAA